MDERYLQWLTVFPGLGSKKAKQVAARFPTYEHLRAATRSELASVAGLSSADVDVLEAFLRGPSGRGANGQLFLCPKCGSFAGTDAECAICGTNVSAIRETVSDGRAEGKGVVKASLSRWQRVAEAAALPEVDRIRQELEQYDRLLEADPTLERAWAKRARLLEKLGRLGDAIDSLAKAAELNPAREEHYRLEVQNLLRSGGGVPAIPPRWKQPETTAAPATIESKLIQALNQYDALLRGDPTLAVARRPKGEILQRIAGVEEA